MRQRMTASAATKEVAAQAISSGSQLSNAPIVSRQGSQVSEWMDFFAVVFSLGGPDGGDGGFVLPNGRSVPLGAGLKGDLVAGLGPRPIRPAR